MSFLKSMLSSFVNPEFTKTKVTEVVASKTGVQLTLDVAGVQVNFRWAPAGTFLMGSPEDEDERWEDETQHEVTLTYGFWVAETPTTQALWEAVTGENPSKVWRERLGDEPDESTVAEQLPVDWVAWGQCLQFVDALNRNYASALPYGYKFAMPTEAQWEYACRAGTSTPFSFGDSLNGDKANCCGENPYGTYDEGPFKYNMTPVRSYAPNPWGLYDMHGNVNEWTADWYDEEFYSDSSASQDPTGPESGSYRVQRGGSSTSDPKDCRSAKRYRSDPNSLGDHVGFRLVLVPQSVQTTQSVEATSEREWPSGDEPETTRQSGALKTLEFGGVQVNFHWAPAGTFLMGSPESEQGHRGNERQREVTHTRGFWVAETQTTQEFWQAVMGDSPSCFGGVEHLPVDSVSWYDCQKFVDTLNSRHSDVLPSGYKYAMPTEAQWEYACRAGTTTPFSFGTSLNGDQANCNGNNPYGTSATGEFNENPVPVKWYEPNAWGLYDMHGNMEEWCFDPADWDHDDSADVMKDSSELENSTCRVLRGGNWSSAPEDCRSASRSCCEAQGSAYFFSFRLFLVPQQES